MSRRKEVSPQRPLTGNTTAQSQRGTPNDHRPTTTLNNTNNNEYSSVGQQNIQETLEESVDIHVGVCESATPAIHLTEDDNSSNRADIRTVIEVDKTVCDNAPRFVVGEDHALLESAEEFGEHGQHCTRHDTAGPSVDGFSTQRECADHTDTISRGESVESGNNKYHTTSNDMSPESVLFGSLEKHIAPCTISSESLEFCTHRKPTIPHSCNALAYVGTGCNGNGTSLHATNILTPMEFDTQIHVNHACAKRKTGSTTEVEITGTDPDSSGSNHSSNSSALVSQKVAEQDDDSSAEQDDDSSAGQDDDSSAKQDDDSSAEQDDDSSAEQDDDSSAEQDDDSSAGQDDDSSAEQDDDSRVDKTEAEHEGLERKSSISSSAEDDPGSRAFFTCRLCFSDRIRHWVLIPCGHMLCYACVRNKLICPFCSAVVEQPIRIRYDYE